MAQVSSKIFIIAGPNGAGKTSLSDQLLDAAAGDWHFVNADRIAAGLETHGVPGSNVQAARLMIEEIDRLAELHADIAIETTLSGRVYATRIPRWQAAGYHVSLTYLRLDSVEYAIDRVASRVRQGGHAIPEQVIRRRFRRGLVNLERLYKPLVDEWAEVDNSGSEPLVLSRGPSK
jgi:predicted ABC-type ATPase